MINQKDIVKVISETYQDVPALLGAVGGDPGAIQYFFPLRPENPTYEAALAKMPVPGLLVSHVNTLMGSRGDIPQWRHKFRVDIKLFGEDPTYADIMQALIDGVPASGDGFSIIECSFNTQLDPLEEPIFTLVRDNEGHDFYRLEFDLQEKGGVTNRIDT